MTGMITAPDDQRKGNKGATVGALVFLMCTQGIATGFIYASGKVAATVHDAKNVGGDCGRRRRVSSTNKTVSLIENEEIAVGVELEKEARAVVEEDLL